MKARRTMDHNDLIAETIKQVSSRFVPDVTEIKNQIDSLISREFIMRAEDDRNAYAYIL